MVSGVQPDLVQQVENDLQSIMAGGTARDVDILLLTPYILRVLLAGFCWFMQTVSGSLCFTGLRFHKLRFHQVLCRKFLNFLVLFSSFYFLNSENGYSSAP